MVSIQQGAGKNGRSGYGTVFSPIVRKVKKGPSEPKFCPSVLFLSIHFLSLIAFSSFFFFTYGRRSAGLPAPPGKPILIPVSTEDTQPDVVGIRWERSPSNGGSAIVGYQVEHRRMGSPYWVRSSPSLCSFPELTLSGLEPGWRYQFRVRARNGLGVSEPSALSDPLTVTLQRSAASAPRFDLELKDTVALENDQVDCPERSQNKFEKLNIHSVKFVKTFDRNEKKNLKKCLFVNQQAEFTVNFSGTPLPKISWFKDGFEIFSSRRTRIMTENGKSQLLIHQTALNDEGEIKCTATNRAGHVGTKAKLLLEG